MEHFRHPFYHKAATVAAIGVTGILAACGRPAYNTPPPGPKYCGDRLVHASAAPGTIVVETGCSSNPEAPVGIYEDSERTPGEVLATAKNGAVLTALCYTTGEDTRDGSGAVSHRWIQVELQSEYPPDAPVVRVKQELPGERAYIPEIWTTGSYEVAKVC